MGNSEKGGYLPSGQAGFLLFCLVLAYIFSFIDRQILALLVTPIKASLGLSDFKIGLVQGPAFSVFFCLAAIPVGWLIDRYDRRLIVVGGLVMWSMATAMCGLVGGFASLFIARMFVGIGEAVLSPAAYSIIPDAFPPDRIVRANAIYSLGSIIGTGLAFLFGGSVITVVSGLDGLPFGYEPWRLTFITAGSLGVIAVVALLIAREPARRFVGGADTPSLGEGLRYIWGRRADYLPLYLTSAFLSMTAYAGLLWYPTHLFRIFAMPPADAGFIIGTIMLTVAPFGTVMTALVTERLARRGHSDAPVRILIALSLLIIPGTLCSLVSDLRLSLVLFSIMAFCQGGFAANVITAIQFITPSRVRGLNGSIYVLVLTLGSVGLGATLVGGISDGLFHDRPDGLSLAMAIVACGAGIGAVLSSRYALGRFRAAVARTGGLPEA